MYKKILCNFRGYLDILGLESVPPPPQVNLPLIPFIIDWLNWERQLPWLWDIFIRNFFEEKKKIMVRKLCMYVAHLYQYQQRQNEWMNGWFRTFIKEIWKYANERYVENFKGSNEALTWSKILTSQVRSLKALSSVSKNFCFLKASTNTPSSQHDITKLLLTCSMQTGVIILLFIILYSNNSIQSINSYLKNPLLLLIDRYLTHFFFFPSFFFFLKKVLYIIRCSKFTFDIDDDFTGKSTKRSNKMRRKNEFNLFLS